MRPKLSEGRLERIGGMSELFKSLEQQLRFSGLLIFTRQTMIEGRGLRSASAALQFCCHSKSPWIASSAFGSEQFQLRE
jgi:hypothetical protein